MQKFWTIAKDDRKKERKKKKELSLIWLQGSELTTLGPIKIRRFRGNYAKAI